MNFHSMKLNLINIKEKFNSYPMNPYIRRNLKFPKLKTFDVNKIKLLIKIMIKFNQKISIY
jgi:hypothetical protein